MLLRLVGAIALVAVWSLLIRLGASMIAKQVDTDDLDPIVGANWLEKQLEIFRWLSLAIVVICLAGFGLAQSLDSIPILMDSMLLQSIVLLTPGILITLATWSAEHSYGVRLGYTPSGMKNHLRSIWNSFRSGLGWLIAPVLLLLGTSDLISALPISETAAGWTTGGVVLLAVLLGLPILIRRLFKTEPIGEPTEQWIMSVMNAAGIKGIRCVRWNTGNQAFNAMVAGFVSRYRTLMVSDRVLNELPREQIAMILLHETAHLRRHHVPLRMVAVMPAWLVGALVTEIAGESSWALTLGSAAGILMTMLILRIVAYRTEFDADIQACKTAVNIAKNVDGVPATFDAAAEALSSALRRVTFDHPSAQKATWLHPSVSDRISCMRRHRDVPNKNNTNVGSIANPA